MTASYGMIVDAALILIFAISIFTAWKRGFFISLMDFVAVAVACIASVWLSGELAPRIYETLISPAILEAVSQGLDSVSASGDMNAKVNAIISALPEFVTSYADAVGINISAALQNVASSSAINGAELAANIEKSIFAPVLTTVCRAVIFIVLFIVLIILLRLAVRLIKGAVNTLLPTVKKLDGFLGACLGVLKGALLVFVLSVAVFFIADLAAQKLPDFATAVEQSKVVGFISGLNPVADFLSL